MCERLEEAAYRVLIGERWPEDVRDMIWGAIDMMVKLGLVKIETEQPQHFPGCAHIRVRISGEVIARKEDLLRRLK